MSLFLVVRAVLCESAELGMCTVLCEGCDRCSWMFCSHAPHSVLQPAVEGVYFLYLSIVWLTQKTKRVCQGCTCYDLF